MRAARSPRWQRLALLVGAALLAFAYRALLDYDPTWAPDALITGSDATFFSPTGNAPLLVYGIAGWLLLRRWKRLRASFGSPPARPIAALGLVAAIAFAFGSARADAPDLMVISAASAAVGLAALLGGRPAARAIALPAVALLALVPIPPVLVNHWVHPLQLATAHTAAALLHAFGVDAIEVADRLGLPSGQVFQVIESCSGLRSTQTLALAALMYADLADRNALQTAVLVAIAPVLGVVVNQVRVMSLILSPTSSFATVHSVQGIAMLVLGIVALAALDAVLVRVFPRLGRPRRPLPPESLEPAAAPPQAPPVRAVGRALAASALLAAVSFAPPAAGVHRALAWSPHDVAPRIDGWQAHPLKLDRLYLGSTTFSEDSYRRYVRGDEQVDVFIGMTTLSRRRSHPWSPKTIALASARPVRRDGTLVLEARSDTPPIRAEVWTVATPEGTQRVLRWHVDTRSLPSEALRSALALDRLTGAAPGQRGVIRLSTPIAAGEPAARSDERLRRFWRALEREIEAAGKRTRQRALREQRRRTARAARAPADG